jgi:hypothetical protein
LPIKPAIKLHRTPANVRMRRARHFEIPPRIQGMRPSRRQDGVSVCQVT